jgi:hypothetical protein
MEKEVAPTVARLFIATYILYRGSTGSMVMLQQCTRPDKRRWDVTFITSFELARINRLITSTSVLQHRQSSLIIGRFASQEYAISMCYAMLS